MLSRSRTRLLASLAAGAVLLGGQLLVAPAAHATPPGYAVDASFAANVSGALSNDASAVAIAADGSVVVGDGFGTLKKFSAAGVEDSTFTSNTANALSGAVKSIGFLSDGSIIVVGGFGERVKKFSAAGVEESTFSTNIANSAGSQSLFNTTAFAVSTLSNDQMYVGGSFNDKLVKLNANGTVDWSFTQGTLDNTVTVKSLAVDSSGHVIAAGYSTAQGMTAVLESMDSTGGSVASMTGNVGATVANGVAVDSADNILVAAKSGVLKKFSPAGTEDTSFTANLGSALSHGTTQDATAVAVQSDDSVVVGGWFTGALKRFDSDGNEDSSFTATVGAALNSVDAVAIQSDDAIVAGGWLPDSVIRYSVPTITPSPSPSVTVAPAPVEHAATATARFKIDKATLSATYKAKIKAAYQAAKAGTITKVTVTAYAKKRNSTGNYTKLATKRAKAVATYLKKLGYTGKVTASAKQRKKAAGLTRRADLVINYTTAG